jgi:hypothetical protein
MAYGGPLIPSERSSHQVVTSVAPRLNWQGEVPVRRWGLNPVAKRRPGRGTNGDPRRSAYIFMGSIVVLIVAFLMKWWLA